MWDSTKEHKESVLCWHAITLYQLFVLYKGLMMDWFNPKHLAEAFERENISCVSTDDLFLFPLQQLIKNK
jgi:sulfate adenylyltransferase subunit 1 (EFTu-like GTPase family)